MGSAKKTLAKSWAEEARKWRVRAELAEADARQLRKQLADLCAYVVVK